jgi:heme/copper-type cytochrome/quinol oxidase subunit 2
MTTLSSTMILDDPAILRTRDVRRRLELLSRFLDTAVRVPGTNFRFGADAMMSVIPGVGSLVAGAVAAYIVFEATRFGLPRRDLARMAGNVVLDSAVGAVPVIGFLFDAVFKANVRNMRILRDHLERTDRVIDGQPTARGGM